MPTIKKPNQHFDATTYTGNGADRSITNDAGFRPDLVWGQARSAAYGSWLYDSVRGATKQIESFGTNQESTQSTMVTAFNSNGFNMGTDTAGNESSITYVAWQWKAGEGTTTVNTSGTISSNVSVNATAGFSVVTYTGNGAIGATVGHGLGVAPSMILLKRRTGATASWLVWHRSLSNLNNNYLLLDTTDAQLSSTNIWGNHTSSVIALDTDSLVNEQNASGSTFVAYCWAQVEGFSRFGSYTGNGSANGVFVYLGFRPKFIIIKKISSGNSWVIQDASRSPFNVVDDYLAADDAAAESTTSQVNIDFLSNGFKLRSAFDIVNSGDYIYMAFAESPFKFSNAR
jgi:hypothetical protein